MTDKYVYGNALVKILVQMVSAGWKHLEEEELQDVSGSG